MEKQALEKYEAPYTLMRPSVSPADLIQYHEEMTNLITKALKEGRDYGKIPGCGDKPSLLKPGGERINQAFNAYPVYEVVDKEIDHDRPVHWVKRHKVWDKTERGKFHWETTEGDSIGLYKYVVRCRLINRSTGECVGEGLGACSSMETKFVERPRDTENTCLKMAEKRAFIGATLNTYALSDRFTADIEDMDPAAVQTDSGKTEGRNPAPGAPPSGPICEKCGKPMKIRKGEHGEFYGCTGYPKCRHTKPKNGNGKPPDKEAAPPAGKAKPKPINRIEANRVLMDALTQLVPDNDPHMIQVKFVAITGHDRFDKIPTDELPAILDKVKNMLADQEAAEALENDGTEPLAGEEEGGQE